MKSEVFSVYDLMIISRFFDQKRGEGRKDITILQIYNFYNRQISSRTIPHLFVIH